MLLGFDRQCITPKLPIDLCGYEMVVRTATEVHDDLYARCLVMNEQDKYYALVQCDLMGLDRYLVEKIYDLVKDLGFEREHIAVFASHTHAGPVGIINTTSGIFSQMQKVVGEGNDELLDFIAKKVACGISNAFKDMQPSSITIGKGHVLEVGKERHVKGLPGDDTLLVLKFIRKDGKEILLYNFACHPTVTGPDNVKITADFPYAVERDLNYDMVMFINGAAGDISTRFTRTSSSFAQVDIFAQRIIDGIHKALEKPIYEGSFDYISIHEYEIDLPIKKVLPIDEAKEKLAFYKNQLKEAKENHLDANSLRVLESFVEGASIGLSMALSLKGLTSELIHFTMIKLQDLIIAVAPGELFSTLGNQLKEKGFEVFGYGCGYYMYIADEHSYDKEYYEAMCSPFEKGVGELLINEMMKKGEELCQ